MHDPTWPPCGSLAVRDGKYGAPVDQLLLTRLDLKQGDVSSRHATFAIRSTVKPSPTNATAASASGRAFWSAEAACAPPNCCSRAAWCAGSTG